jgi:uncharacterized protein (UPF0548 family)
VKSTTVRSCGAGTAPSPIRSGVSSTSSAGTRGPTSRSVPRPEACPSATITSLGSGAQAFAAARAALREWRFIPAGFARLEPAGAPVHAGEVVAIVLRVLGIWWINATRIAYVIDEPDRFGFAWGTLPDHVVHGEERFCVERTATGDVYYDIVSFSRPGLLARIGAPVARRVRDEFVRGSLAAMAAATARPAS